MAASLLFVACAQNASISESAGNEQTEQKQQAFPAVQSAEGKAGTAGATEADHSEKSEEHSMTDKSSNNGNGPIPPGGALPPPPGRPAPRPASPQMPQMPHMTGGTTEYYVQGLTEDIKSQDIESFSYVRSGSYVLFYGPKDGKVHFACRGGDRSARDGSAFAIDYLPDLSDPAEAEKSKALLSALQEIVVSDNLAKGNGYYHFTSGLPDGIGDTIDIAYASGEKIHKYSNQGRNLGDDTAAKIHEAFLAYAHKSGLDFTTAGSNLQLYDDADEEFVQGTWKGKHFGAEFMVVFQGKNVKIYKDGALTDDCGYTIINGRVRTDRLKKLPEGKKYRGDQYDYESFSEVVSLTKHNWFTMDASFDRSSCTLFNFDKKDPRKK